MAGRGRVETMRQRHVLLGALVVLILGLTGCGGSTVASDAGDGTSITVVGLDTMRFTPETIKVKAGEPAKIVFRNGGILVHDLITEGGDKPLKLANVGGGKAASGVFQAAAPGTYAMVCVQPGHKEAGMVGKIVVE
jgi:uncharacterized cupredoxin-like copper-binding protein